MMNESATTQPLAKAEKELMENQAAESSLKHLISLDDLSATDVEEIFDISAELKHKMKRGDRPPRLKGHVLTQIFEKPSLRTRNSFEAAIIQLGGGGIFLTSEEAGLQGRETLADIARVLTSYSDAVVMRTFSQDLIRQFASFSSCPVINGLSDERHPCQALTDLFTLKEVFGELKGQRLVYIGDGNNVAKSLAIATSLMQLSMTLAAPPVYKLENSFLDELKQRFPTADISQVEDPEEAVKDADVVYTDVWASMGQESEADERQRIFAPYQVNSQLMASAPDKCLFMHDLPARRSMEVTDDVIDGPNSIAFQQAENRMHLAKGLLVWLLG